MTDILRFYGELAVEAAARGPAIRMIDSRAGQVAAERALPAGVTCFYTEFGLVPLVGAAGAGAIVV